MLVAIPRRAAGDAVKELSNLIQYPKAELDKN